MQVKMISVIVLTYKNGDFLLETIDSILKQSYSAIELIIAEDGDPKFDSKKITNYIENNKRDNIVRYNVRSNDKNLGTVKNINIAIDQSNGEYIKIIAGDDVYPSSSVFEKQISYLEKNEDLQIVVGRIQECDNDAKPLKTYIKKLDYDLIKHNDLKSIKKIVKKQPELLSTQSMCFRRTFFEKYGKYDENLVLIEDLPMMLRIIMKQIPVEFDDNISINHRGQVGVSNDSKVIDKTKLRYYLDLQYYFGTLLMEYKEILGRIYVVNHYQMARFRVDSIQSDRLCILKYLPDLLIYSLCNAHRVGQLFFRKIIGRK